MKKPSRESSEGTPRKSIKLRASRKPRRPRKSQKSRKNKKPIGSRKSVKPDSPESPDSQLAVSSECCDIGIRENAAEKATTVITHRINFLENNQNSIVDEGLVLPKLEVFQILKVILLD